LVKAACTSQISEAIGRLGVKEGGVDLVLVAIEAEDAVEDAVRLIGGELSAESIEKGPEGRARIAEQYDLNEPLEKNLLEKIALIATG
jgi:tRNA threonylcarbamoyladenosine modification (KEOPS) complex Cgi121 subunit